MVLSFHMGASHPTHRFHQEREENGKFQRRKVGGKNGKIQKIKNGNRRDPLVN